jgi:hypothetical protein
MLINLSFASIRAAVENEFQAVTDEAKAEIHRFIDFIDMKHQRVAAAEALLKAEGFTVIEPQPAAPATPNV